MAALVKEKKVAIKALEEHAGEYNERRGQIREQLPRPLVGRYERISRGRNGEAVTDVEAGTCASCNMKVPPQVFIRLQRMESLEQCQSCQRLLVYTEGLAEDAASEVPAE